MYRNSIKKDVRTGLCVQFNGESLKKKSTVVNKIGNCPTPNVDNNLWKTNALVSKETLNSRLVTFLYSVDYMFLMFLYVISHSASMIIIVRASS